MDSAKEYADWVQLMLYDENTVEELKNEKLEHDAEEEADIKEGDIYDDFDDAGGLDY